MKNLKINYLFILSILFSIQATNAEGPVFKEPIYLKTAVYENMYGKYTTVVTLKMEENKPVAALYDYNHNNISMREQSYAKVRTTSKKDYYYWSNGYSIDRTDLFLIKQYIATGREEYRSKLERISSEDFLKLKEEHLIIKRKKDEYLKQKQKELEDGFQI